MVWARVETVCCECAQFCACEGAEGLERACGSERVCEVLCARMCVAAWFVLFILTWQGRYHDHAGGFPKASLIHCTWDVQTPTFSPNVRNSIA